MSGSESEGWAGRAEVSYANAKRALKTAIDDLIEVEWKEWKKSFLEEEQEWEEEFWADEMVRYRHNHGMADWVEEQLERRRVRGVQLQNWKAREMEKQGMRAYIWWAEAGGGADGWHSRLRIAVADGRI